MLSAIRAIVATSSSLTAPGPEVPECSRDRILPIFRSPTLRATTLLVYSDNPTIPADRESLDVFTANGSGSLTQGGADTVTNSDGHTQITSLTGTLALDSSTGGPTYGRGTMSMALPGQTVHAAFYVVSAGELFYVSTDRFLAGASLLVGTMLSQSGPFANSSLNGPGVFHVTGVNPSTSLNDIMIGQWVATPSNTTLAAEYSRDDGGSTIFQNNFTSAYSVVSNGRVNITSPSGLPSFFGYMTAANKAFLVSNDASVMTGMAEPQTIPTGGFTNATIAGDFFLGTIERASRSVIDASGVANFDGVGTWTSIEDASLPSGNYSDQVGSLPYTITSAQTGRGTFSSGARRSLCSTRCRQLKSTISFSIRQIASRRANNRSIDHTISVAKAFERSGTNNRGQREARLRSFASPGLLLSFFYVS